MKKLTLTEQEQLFAKDCRLINLRYEYRGYTGTEKWSVVTELTEEELWEKYPDLIRHYLPFVLLSVAEGKVIEESWRNDHKHEMRAVRTTDNYCYEDDIFERFHREIIAPYIDPIEEAEQEYLEAERERIRLEEIAKVRQVLEMLSPIQKRRLIKFVLMGKNARQIAEEEGTYHSSVLKSIAAAKKNFRKFYGEL